MIFVTKKLMINVFLNPLNAKFTKWSNTLKRLVGKLPTNCLSVFDHFMGLAFKGLITLSIKNGGHAFLRRLHLMFSMSL